MTEGMDDDSAAPPPAARSVDRGWIVGGVVVMIVGIVGLGAVAASSGSSTVAEVGAVASSVESTEPRVERTTVPLLPAAGSSTTSSSSSTTTDATTTTLVPSSTEVVATAPPLDEEPSVVARPVPVDPPPPPPAAPPAPWADSVFTTAGGHVSTDVGCARDLSAAALDEFFARRVGPVIGWDYQHVYPLGGGRYLWLFQDTFIDHSNTATTLGNASFAHNSALVQEGNCFRLLHRGTTARPTPFELGTGTTTLNTWFWPMGGEVHGGRLYVFWAEMRKDYPDPKPPDGLGWHPVATHVATYDKNSLARLDFRRATSGGASPIYGYAVESDATHTYLFGNTFEQNLSREGGWFNGPHSGTKMFLARVPRGQLFDAPEYWTRTGWTADRRNAHAFLQRHWSEFPMQPRYMDGQWIASTAVNGYWGDAFELDVANNPWGPWTTIESRPLVPRGGDWKMNTYHAHLMPWRDGFGQAVVSVSNNARNMLRDAWPHPYRYRPNVLAFPWQAPPPETTLPPTTTTTSSSTTTTTTTISPPSTTTTSSSTTSSTTTPSSSTTSSTTSSTSSTTSTTSSTSSTTSTTTTEPPPPSTSEPPDQGGADESSSPPTP